MKIEHTARVESGEVPRAIAQLDSARGVRGISDDRRSRSCLTVNRFPNFLSVDGHVLGGNDAKPHFIAANFHHCYRDVVVNHDALIFFSGQDKHRRVSFSGSDGVETRGASQQGTSGPPSSRRAGF